MIGISLSGDSVQVACDKSDTLGDFGCSLEYALSWFLCHGVHRCSVRVDPGGPMTLFSPVRPYLDMSIAAISSMESLAEEKLLPRTIESWEIDGGKVFAHEGIDCCFDGSRVALKGETHQMEHSISEVCFGIAGLMVAAFVRGARLFEYQIALSLSRFLFDLPLDKKGVIDFLTRSSDYDTATRIGDIIV